MYEQYIIGKYKENNIKPYQLSIINHYNCKCLSLSMPRLKLIKKNILQLTLPFLPFDCASHYTVLQQGSDLEAAYLYIV